MSRPKGIALALGGGGARGLSHIGVLRVLEREGISIGTIAGSSMGALIGAMYSLNPAVDAIEQKWRDFMASDTFDDSGLGYYRNRVSDEEEEGSFFRQVSHKVKGRVIINLAQSRSYLVKRERLTVAFDYFLGEHTFEDCTIPLTMIATDLMTGEAVCIREGKLIRGLEASSSIPGFFPPYEKDGMLLIDGTVSDPIPVREAIATGARPVIAAGVSRKISPAKNINSAIDILTRTESIMSYHLSRYLMDEADVCMAPETGNAHWSEFYRMDEMISRGEEAAERVLPDIKRAIRKYGIFGWMMPGVRKY